MAAKARAKPAAGLTKEEREAMRETLRERKRQSEGADGEADVRAAIAAMAPADRAIAERIHAIVKGVAPDIECRTWYGFPAYAKDGDVIVFFKPAAKFKERYSTLGFSDSAKLDDGHMWPTSYAITALTAADETKIKAAVKKAVGA